jgi:hypothetical protein
MGYIYELSEEKGAIGMGIQTRQLQLLTHSSKGRVYCFVNRRPPSTTP